MDHVTKGVNYLDVQLTKASTSLTKITSEEGIKGEKAMIKTNTENVSAILLSRALIFRPSFFTASTPVDDSFGTAW
ncbi:hypothetical protein KSP40_PGU004230 [Platanthera guangdongensis]|uniref:Uncharacterized protein n=1 Tax=Platanthera guangdongensis TaxID=2320717 RepID=A0ABR2MFI2_9ASPA